MGKKEKEAAKKKNGIAGTIFIIVVIIFLAKGLGNSDDPDPTPVPPSVPTDVGTLPPGLDK